MPERSLLIVNYHSAALTGRAIASARSSSSEPLQIVVVDNSMEASELAALGDAGADEVIAAPQNLGYGGALNLGRTRCDGEVLILSNPDVVFHGSAIDLLIQSVTRGAALSGPAFSWDDAEEWLLPPAEMPSLRRKLEEVAASRFAVLRGALQRERFRERVAFWNARQPRSSGALSGAVLCLRRDLFDELNGFDRRFFLYFEEIDLIRRARAIGRIEYVPAARCRHLFSQSARLSEESARYYLASERLFFEKWYGRMGTVVMNLGAGVRREPIVRTSSDWRIPVPGDPQDFVVELSPFPEFVSAAGHFPRSEVVVVPLEVIASYPAPVLYARVVHRSKAEVRDSVALLKSG